MLTVHTDADTDTTPTHRSLARRLGRRAGIAAALGLLVVVGGLLSLRVAGDEPKAQPGLALGASVRATLDPLASLAGAGGRIEELQAAVERHPSDPELQAKLGIAYLQQARQTGDPGYYGRADRLLGAALELDATNLDATLGAGSLALTRHDFTHALVLGRRAQDLSNGFSPAALGIIGDSLVELGRYDQAFAAFQKMGEIRPGLTSYARLSYALELTGDLDGAIDLMRRAARAGSGAPESTNWTRVQLGQLLIKAGRLPEAERAYREALFRVPGDVRAQAGLAAVAAARGDLATAERELARAASVLPLPEIVTALADVRTARGDRAGADEALALARTTFDLFAAAGGDADLERAALDAAHPRGTDAAATVRLARRALAERPSIHAQDALAWALYRTGDCRGALRAARAANRLGTVDPIMRYHLGAAAACAGEKGLARTALHAALADNPDFNPVAAPAARRLLVTLGGAS